MIQKEMLEIAKAHDGIIHGDIPRDLYRETLSRSVEVDQLGASNR